MLDSVIDELIFSPVPEAGPSGTTHDYELPSPAVPEPQTDTVVPPQLESASEIPDVFKSYVAQLVNNMRWLDIVNWTEIQPQVAPFQAQIGLLQAELQQRSSQEADIRTLTLQLQSMQMEVQSLRSQANMAPHLQNEVAQMKQLVFDLLQGPTVDAHKPSEKSLGKARAS